MKVEMRRSMKKRMVSIMLLMGILTLVSCGKSDNINEERTDKEVIQNETIEATIQEESKADELETDADKDEYCLDEDSNVSVYFDATKEKNVIVDGDKEIPFQINGYAPEVVGAYKMDIDNNKMEEYVVTVCEGRGTGYYVMGLAIIEEGEEQPVFYLSPEDIAKQFNERISYEYDNDISLLSLTVDKEEPTEVFLQESEKTYESKFESVAYGDISYVQYMNGEFWIRGGLGLYFKDMVIAQYEPSVEMAAPIIFSDGYDYSIGKMGVKVVENFQEFPKSDEYSEIMAEFAADITHNGYDDRIILTVPKGATLDEVKSGVYPGLLYVFERTAEGLSDYYFMKREFSPTHVGNGQLFVTTVDDKDYLIETNFWAGQGCFTYSYDVFFEDYDTKYEMESENLVFEDCDKPGDTTEFFASLSKWINDSTYVLYVADIDYEPDLFYSTEENKISPVEYLQYK